MLGDSTAGSSRTQPDSILVTLFDEAIDEEIALERAEIDVAVFWPGELSSRLRGDPKWRTDLHGARARGFLAVRWEQAMPGDSIATLPDIAPLASLNRTVFRGDLSPMPGAEAGAAVFAQPARFIVDESIPGHRELQRFLDANSPARAGLRTARLLFVDDAPATLENRAAESAATPAFTIDCRIACHPAFRDAVAALGPGMFANLVTCGMESKR